jgi:hypothetical protein
MDSTTEGDKELSTEEQENILQIIKANRKNPDAIQFKSMNSRLSVINEEECEESVMIQLAGFRKLTIHKTKL